MNAQTINQPYKYSILRYTHDLVTGEFVNVGVAVHFPNLNTLDGKFRHTTARILAFFPGSRADAIKKQLKFLEKKISTSNHSVILRSPLDEDLLSMLSQYMVADDSGLQWSSVFAGISTKPEKTLDQLYNRFVAKYDDANHGERKSDQDVWQRFKKTLPKNEIFSLMHAKTISAKDGEIEFDHALKNGVWHCFQPVSFDLSSSSYINEKATKWLGQCINIKDTSEKFKLYFLLARPSENALADEYEKAVRVLSKIPFDKELVEEDQFIALSEKVKSVFTEAP